MQKIYRMDILEKRIAAIEKNVELLLSMIPKTEKKIDNTIMPDIGSSEDILEKMRARRAELENQKILNSR